MRIFILVFCLLFSLSVHADLTTAQKATIKADIAANSDMNTLPANGDGSYEIARLYNLPAATTFIVWRTSVPVDEIMNNGFDWTRVDNATVGKGRIWEWMTALGTINASKVNIRAGIDEAWSGAANATHLANIYTHLKRQATRLEKLLATGTGSDASPATMGYEGSISYQELEQFRY